MSAKTLAEVERDHILEVVRLTGGNLSHAVELLGIGRATLYRKLHEYAAVGQE
ncbi:MAG TPA: helix-turn-helix domain-containing protein [Thermomicrobiales bacterium]|nr:helix-turn-helix domain-containing protein [Thermomicrobiales bacterium]